MTATFYPEDLKAVDRALQALHAERALMDRWSMHSVELALAIDDLESLRDRMKAAQDEIRDSIVKRTAFPELRAVS